MHQKVWWKSLQSRPWLPDGVFSNQKSKFGKILDGLAMEEVGIFYGHLVYFMVIWYILWTFYCHLVHFPPFWHVVPKKSGNPDQDS
jgi:hypothetical protein